MKMYLIKFETCGYDMYDSFVVAAQDKKDLINIIKKEHSGWSHPVDFDGGYSIKEIGEYKFKTPKIIIGSFNAG